MRTTLFIGLSLAVAGAAHGQFFPERDPADVNGDGLINAADLAEVMGKWGKAEHPQGPVSRVSWSVVGDLMVSGPLIRRFLPFCGRNSIVRPGVC